MEHCSPLSFSNSTRRLNIDASPSHLSPPLVLTSRYMFLILSICQDQVNGFTEYSIPTPSGPIKPH